MKRRALLQLFGSIGALPLAKYADAFPETNPLERIPIEETAEVATGLTRLFMNGVELNDVLSISGPTTYCHEIDVTDFGSSYRDFAMPDDERSISVEMIGAMSGIQFGTIHQAHHAAEKAQFKLVLSYGVRFDFDAYVSEITKSEFEGIERVEVGLRMSSPVTVSLEGGEDALQVVGV